MGTLDGREDLVLGIEDECRWVDENTTARVHGQITGEEDEIAGGSPPRKANHRGIAGRLPHYPSLHGTMRNEVGDGRHPHI